MNNFLNTIQENNLFEKYENLYKKELKWIRIKMNKNLITLSEERIQEILKIQKEVVKWIVDSFKWREYLFTSSQEELQKKLNNTLNLWKWLVNKNNNLLAYWIVNKDVWLYKWNTLLKFDEKNTAQIDVIVVRKENWWEWLWKELLPKLEKEYLEKNRNIKTLLATISPYNRASLRLFLLNHYFIDWLFLREDKYQRIIVRKDIERN